MYVMKVEFKGKKVCALKTSRFLSPPLLSVFLIDDPDQGISNRNFLSSFLPPFFLQPFVFRTFREFAKVFRGNFFFALVSILGLSKLYFLWRIALFCNRFVSFFELLHCIFRLPASSPSFSPLSLFSQPDPNSRTSSIYFPNPHFIYFLRWRRQNNGYTAASSERGPKDLLSHDS